MLNSKNSHTSAEVKHSAFSAFHNTMDHHHQAAVAAAAAAWDQVRLHHGGQYPPISVPTGIVPPPTASTATASNSAMPPTSIAALGDAAAALQLGLPGHPHAAANSMHPYFNGPHAAASQHHQDYLNRLHASAALAASDPAMLNRSSRKRALSASPGYSELDLANLMRHSPTSMQLLNAAAANGASPSSSGSYGHLSGANSPVLQGLHQASSHLQQLQAHLLRTSPYLSPQNSFIHAAAAASYLPPPASMALFGAASVQQQHKAEAEASKEDNVVSSTIDIVEEAKKERSKKSSKSRNKIVQEPCSSTIDREDEDEKDFEETHCHWVGCDKGDFGSQEQLVRHLNNDHVGSNKKSFICQWKDCAREEKPFKAQYMLVVHLRRHTGEKPHRCTFEQCNKAYSRLENLKTHLRSHTGEKPYTCEFPGCSKAFSNASDRAKHQNRTHSNEKPYACKAPGCTKRYTDPSSLRKHVKTVHGAEFYASKRHKGEHNMDTSDSRQPDYTNHHQRNHQKRLQAAASAAAKLESSSGAITSTGSPGSGSGVKSTPESLPISDNNVSTTNDALLDEHEWDNDADINMAVAAAIGVGEDQEDVMSNRLANATSRLSGKRSLLRSSNSSGMNSSGLSVQQQQHQHHPHHPQQHQQPQHGLSEINRSIEKMTLQPPQSQSNNSRVVTTGDISTALLSSKNGGGGKTSRRDSDWTSVSTEDPGYGSMRSDHNTSRRCSELSTASQVSNVSTRAVVNTPAWAESSGSGANSRRSSSVGPIPQHQQQQPQHHQQQQQQLQGARIGQHLSRLHKKAQEHLQHQENSAGRQSVMSECAMAPNHDQSSSSTSTTLSGYASGSAGGTTTSTTTSRRASDPVRVAQSHHSSSSHQRNNAPSGMTRHRSGSYNGQSHNNTQPGYQFNQPKMYQYNQGSASGFNHCPPGFQPQPGTSSHQWQFNTFQDGGTSFHPPPPNYNYNSNTTTNFNQAVPPPPPQWGNTTGQQQHWNNSWNYYNGNNTSGAGSSSNPNAAAAEVSASYQRTLEYVQQCQQQQQQSWNNPSAGSATTNPGAGNTQ